MCQFISFSVDRDGNVYCLLGEERKQAKLEGNNPDSHSFISDYFGIDEDETWKFEIQLFKNDIDKLCEGEVPDKLNINDIETLKKWYDGGIPFNEMPLEIFDKVATWICEHLEDIKQAGRIQFPITVGDQIMKSQGQEVIEFSVARNREELAEEIASYIIDVSWGWDIGGVIDEIIGRKGYMVSLEPRDNKLQRLRVRILNWEENKTYYRIFISRYKATFISRTDEGEKIGEEDRIFIYPVYKVSKEGEMR